MLRAGVLLCFFSGASWANAQSDAGGDLDYSCSQLLQLQLQDTRFSRAEVVQTDSFTPPGADQALSLPKFCRVVGITAPAINFEVWLPLENWNGKFQGVGNGGMAGTISYGALATALRRGYASASTDTGHQAGPVPFDATWASGRPDLVADFGHRALHVTTVNAKSVTETFYQQAPAYSYYTGCSKGGQQGLMEAQRYPGDYDGIVAGAPAHDWTRFYAGAHLWYSLAMLDEPESYIPQDKLQVIEDTVIATCDVNDGVSDGIISNPMQCTVNPQSMVCPIGDETQACLSPAQATTVSKIWSGVTNSDGLVYPPLVPGGEAAPGAWGRWITGDQAFTSLHWRGGEGFFRWFVFDDKDWDFTSFDFDTDLAYALEKVGPAVDATDSDLRAMRDRGAKLIVYHGWSDPDISPLSAIDYFEEVATTLAPDKQQDEAFAEVNDFYRLFMVPGMGHCSGGRGPDQFDALTALENWVEHGVAPEHITASKVVNNEVVRSRPLCVYPEVARYLGNGSTDDGANFSCVAP